MSGKLAKLLSLLLVATVLLVACAPAATAVPPTAVPPAEPPAAVPPTAVPPTAVPPTAIPEPVAPAYCKDAKSGDQVTVIYQWSGAEEEKFNAILKPFIDACGVKVVAESSRDAAVLDTRVKSTPPDVLFWPSTAPLSLYSDKLVALDTNGAEVANYADYWKTLGSKDGKWLALPAKADIKSIIWYSPAQFEAFGYTVPTTFEELDALVEKMVADGNVPWSMGFGSDAATGWTGSDFVQDLMLTTQGPDFVMKLISGEVAYDDAGVVSAYQTYQKWASDPKYTVGGADGTVNTKFLDAIYLVFADPAKAMMVKQSGFAGGEILKQYPSLKYGTDYDFFAFPGAKGMQGGADYMMAFGTSPAAQALIGYLTSQEGAETWATVGFDLSPNKLATGKYTDTQLTKKAEALASATGFTPDLGDTIPAPFGETEWKALIGVVQGGDIATELSAVAAAQKEALSK